MEPLILTIVVITSNHWSVSRTAAIAIGAFYGVVRIFRIVIKCWGGILNANMIS